MSPAYSKGAGLYFPQEVQLAGKKALSIEDFVRGRQEFIGAMLGNSDKS